MATIAEWLKIDGEQVRNSLQAAREKLDHAEGELVLDFSSVSRIDTQALTALGKLVVQADEKTIKLVLRGVNVDIYKVLKLARLSHRVTFLT